MGRLPHRLGGGQLSGRLSASVTQVGLAGCGWNDSDFISPPGLGWGLDTDVLAPGLPPACCGAEGLALTSRASVSPEIGQDDLRDGGPHCPPRPVSQALPLLTQSCLWAFGPCPSSIRTCPQPGAWQGPVPLPAFTGKKLRNREGKVACPRPPCREQRGHSQDRDRVSHRPLPFAAPLGAAHEHAAGVPQHLPPSRSLVLRRMKLGHGTHGALVGGQLAHLPERLRGRLSPRPSGRERLNSRARRPHRDEPSATAGLRSGPGPGSPG